MKKKSTKLFELLPEQTKKKLLKPKRVCAMCGKPIKWPNVVLYRPTKRVCKECYKLIKEVKNEITK